MNTQTNNVAGTSRASIMAKLIPLTCAFLLGVVLIGGTGFAHTSALHNASHDYRHSMGFPCH